MNLRSSATLLGALVQQPIGTDHVTIQLHVRTVHLGMKTWSK